jgi:hypothetical protein
MQCWCGSSQVYDAAVSSIELTTLEYDAMLVRLQSEI